MTPGILDRILIEHYARTAPVPRPRRRWIVAKGTMSEAALCALMDSTTMLVATSLPDVREVRW